MTGFLESGKTSFLNFTLAQEYFQIDEPTLLILCEEGEEEYDKKVLKKSRTSVEVIDSIEELTTERLVAGSCRWHHQLYPRHGLLVHLTGASVPG